MQSLRTKLRTRTANRLASNFFSLSTIQIASYLLPLITIPYLVRVLGVEKFGLIAFAQAVVQYFVILTDYGFGLSATKEVAENKGNSNRITEIFTSVLAVKIALMAVSFLALSLFIFSFEAFSKEWQLFYLTFGIVVGQVLFPVWYFQGIEKMHVTAIVNIVPKVIFTVSIFIFVTSSEDYLYVPLINSLGFILAGAVSLWLALSRYKVTLVRPAFKQVVYQLKEGWHIFLGSISSNFSMLNVTFLLGVLTNPTMVAYYAAVEKIIRPIASLNRPVISAIFPHLANTAKSDPFKAYSLSKNVSLLVSGIMFIVGMVMLVFSDGIVKLVFGEEFILSSTILKIMAVIPMLNTVMHIYAIPNMVIFDFKKTYSKILFYGFVFSLIASYLSIKLFEANGAAIATLLTDVFVTAVMVVYLKKHLRLAERV